MGVYGSAVVALAHKVRVHFQLHAQGGKRQAAHLRGHGACFERDGNVVNLFFIRPERNGNRAACFIGGKRNVQAVRCYAPVGVLVIVGYAHAPFYLGIEAS